MPTVTLNAAGQKLLARFHRLPTSLSVTQTQAGVSRLVLERTYTLTPAKAKRKTREK